MRLLAAAVAQGKFKNGDPMLALRILVALSGAVATIVFFLTWMFATSAPQQSAGFEMALAIAVIPYVFYRVIADISEANVPGENRTRPALTHNARMAIWAAGIVAFFVGGLMFMSMFDSRRVDPSAKSDAARQACQEFKAARGDGPYTSGNPTAIACKERGYW